MNESDLSQSDRELLGLEPERLRRVSVRLRSGFLMEADASPSAAQGVVDSLEEQIEEDPDALLHWGENWFVRESIDVITIRTINSPKPKPEPPATPRKAWWRR